MLCRILGPVAVEVDGAAVELGGPVPRRLLAALSTGMGAPLDGAELAELVWGAQQPNDVMKTIRVVVHRLRAALGPRGREWIAPAPGGYRLAAGPGGVDHELFADGVATGLRALAAGRAAEAAEALESALRLWRGRPWPEFDESAAVAASRARLLELREVALEELQAARLECGETTQAVVALSGAITETPYRERRWELLALALYRSGRQAQALAELRRVRDLLVDELGVEPGPALRELERRMLGHDPELLLAGSPSHRIETTESAGAQRVPMVPRPLSALIGRGGELRMLDELLTARRLVTVIGPAGVGKTRIAVEYAAERPDVWLVRLADIHGSAAIAPTIAAAIGLSGVAGDPMTAVCRALTGQPGLLVLDNCEHLVDELVPIVSELLAHASGSRVLATSRQALGIAGEQLMPLRPLSVDAADGRAGAAVELLFERVRAGRADWRHTPADAAAARTICRALDGLPLAIELAAARERALGLSTIATHLHDRVDVLAPTARGSLSPHDSLGAAIEWSIDLLDSADRALLLRLWPFEGGFTWQAVESVRTDRGGAVLAGLAALVDRSVLTVDLGSGRYRLLETIRRHCRDADPDPTASLAAHAVWVRELARGQAALLTGPRSSSAAALLAAEMANIRAGFDHDLTHHPIEALRTAGALGNMWVTIGSVPEGMRCIRAALAACPDAAAVDRAGAMIALSICELHAGDARTALRLAESVIESLDESDPAHEMPLLKAYSRQCNALADLVDLAALRPAHRRFRMAAASPNAPDDMRVNAGLGVAIMRFHDGDVDGAAETMRANGEFARECGYLWGEGISELLLAWLLLGRVVAEPDRILRVFAHLTSAVAAFERQPNASEVLVCLYAGVCALILSDRAEIALRLYAAVRAHAARIGIDPCRYLRLAGPEVAARVNAVLDAAQPAARTPAWQTMIGLFHDAVGELETRGT
ncbi:AfsR/SARP family transcriptional regulator [Nocardia arthritidis]|nr:BTAD domain-containing putative transcriptional regulator [Nocardia arthritidis]